MKAVCVLSVIPVRSLPSDASEMVSQLLLGDCLSILGTKKQWLKIKCDFDGYEGWIDSKQIEKLTENEYNQYTDFFNVNSQIDVELAKSQKQISALKGSLIPKQLIKNRIQQSVQSNSEEEIIKFAKSYMGSPYLWGGKTEYGIDCSGFTQIVFRMAGISIKRDASQQVTQGNSIEFENHKPLDLAFFQNEKGNVTHVGICLPDKRIIHAAGEVRIDSLSENGIYNSERKETTHSFHSIRRFI
jgi:cell wall-associated NlpC family hydrolase